MNAVRRDVVKRLLILIHFVVLLIGATASVRPQTAPDPDFDKARELLKTRSIESYQQAIGLLEKIVGRQPENLAAHITLAQAYTSFPSFALLPPKQRYAKVRSEAEKALALDANSSAAHRLLGIAALNSWHWQEAVVELKRAVDLAPGDPDTHASLARYFATQGDFDAARSEIERAQRAAPDPAVFATAAAEISYWAHDYDRAIEVCNSTIEKRPDQAGPRYFLGKTLRAQKRFAEAIVAFQKEAEITHRDAGALMELASAYLAAGREKDAQPLVDEVKGRVGKMYVPVYQVAAYYARRGDHDEAMRWLQRAYDDESAHLIWMKVDPLMDPLRNDPRFQHLLKQVGF
jgi:tetratricopeptide (TPR) repeat protein